MDTIDKVGLELEGAWPYDIAYENRDLRIFKPGFVGDGSVNVSTTTPAFLGEYNSIPMSNIEDVKNIMKVMWPKWFNQTCGFHIHVSTKNVAAYSQMMEKSFYKAFIQNAQKIVDKITEPNDKARFQSRLNGDNQYCMKKFIPDVQVQETGKSGNRYYHLNFCWNLHKTMEIRLLPMMKLENGIMALEETWAFIEDYIKTPKRKKIWNADLEETEPQKKVVINI